MDMKTKISYEDCDGGEDEDGHRNGDEDEKMVEVNSDLSYT